MMKSKRAVKAVPNMLIVLALILFFTILAYSFLFTDLGPRTINVANYYAFSKVGVTINPEIFGKISQAGFLDAKITYEPLSPVCAFETVYFSANSTSLPKGTSIENVTCYWDFDLASEPCSFYSRDEPPPSGLDCTKGAPANNSNTEDDYESSCSISHSDSWPRMESEKQGVGLVVVEPAGRSDKATALVKATYFCACAASSNKCPGGAAELKLSPALGSKELGNGDTFNISFNSSWELANFHMILKPGSQGASNLQIAAGSHKSADYAFYGELPNTTVVYGSDLLRAIEAARGNCNTSICPVQLKFYFSKGSVVVQEVWVPLSKT